MTNKLTQPIQIDDFAVPSENDLSLRWCYGHTHVKVNWVSHGVNGAAWPVATGVSLLSSELAVRTTGQGKNLTCDNQFGEQKLVLDNCTA
ncbi:MAG: hypothetical protein IPI14_04660 [Polaromonas sp.]|nr:hypothetical protein [Polaromonas sp.]